MMKIQIRQIQEEDASILAQIEAESFSRPWSEKDFRELLEHPYCFYLVAVVEGQIAGCCGFTNICNEADIDKVVVAGKYRNLGIAQAMLEELIARGDNMGVEAYTLEVRVSNAPAIHIYEKYGFRPEGIRPGFYDKPREDALIMWRR